MVLQVSVKELKVTFDNEISRVRALRVARIGNASNNNGQLHKCAFVRYLLDAVDDGVKFTLENCRGDEELRSYALANSGSVVECLVNAVIDSKRKDFSKAWKDSEDDVVLNRLAREIKFSGDSHYKATPATNGKNTILVNRSGVSIIAKNDVHKYADSKGRLPATGLFGRRTKLVEMLEDALGIVDGYEE